MSDSPRTDGARSLESPNGGRESKIEQLLLTGLDHYFAGQYEDAVNIWTRALFLDRSHSRARAYIERARTALAERHRQGEELLQNGLEALRRGDVGEARRLLTAAVSGGAPPDEALALLERLNHLDPNIARPPQPSRGRGAWPRLSPASAGPSARATMLGRVGLGVLAAAVAIFLLVTGPTWRAALFPEPVPSPSAVVPTSPESVPPLPRRADMALSHAQSLAGTGRLRDALAALDLVRSTDPEKTAADGLRAVIQRRLIDLASPPEGLNTDLTARHP